MSFFDKFKKAPKGPPPSAAEQDEDKLRALTESGINVRDTAEVSFLLYFDTEAVAKSAASAAEAEGYRAELHDPPTSDGDWLVMLMADFAPSRDEIKTRRARMEALAHELGGEFDDWEMIDD